MNTQQFSLIIMVGVSLLVLIVYLQIRKNKNPDVNKNKGREYAEQKAVGILRRFSKVNGYRFLPSLSLPNGTVLQGVCVGEFGVLALKTYGYNGEVYGNSTDENWLRVGYEDSREYFRNPVLEASLDVQALRKLLQKTKARNVPIEVVSVFTNKKVVLGVGKREDVLKLKEWKRFLGKDKYQKQNDVPQELVFEVLQGS